MDSYCIYFFLIVKTELNYEKITRKQNETKLQWEVAIEKETRFVIDFC